MRPRPATTSILVAVVMSGLAVSASADPPSSKLGSLGFKAAVKLDAIRSRLTGRPRQFEVGSDHTLAPEVTQRRGTTVTTTKSFRIGSFGKVAPRATVVTETSADKTVETRIVGDHVLETQTVTTPTPFGGTRKQTTSFAGKGRSRVALTTTTDELDADGALRLQDVLDRRTGARQTTEYSPSGGRWVVDRVWAPDANGIFTERVVARKNLPPPQAETIEVRLRPAKAPPEVTPEPGSPEVWFTTQTMDDFVRSFPSTKTESVERMLGALATADKLPREKFDRAFAEIVEQAIYDQKVQIYSGVIKNKDGTDRRFRGRTTKTVTFSMPDDVIAGKPQRTFEIIRNAKGNERNQVTTSYQVTFKSPTGVALGHTTLEPDEFEELKTSGHFVSTLVERVGAATAATGERL